MSSSINDNFPEYRNYSSKLQVIESISPHLNYQEVKYLILFAGNRIDDSEKATIKDAKTFFINLFRNTSWDEANNGCISHYLKCIRRFDLLHMVALPRKRKLDEGDTFAETPQKRLRRSPRNIKLNDLIPNGKTLPQKQRLTCNIRLRVQAVFQDTQAALKDANITSEKEDSEEKKLDLLSNALEFLRNRDLGIIICDVTFSDLAHLEGLWSDYISGHLIDALQDVLLTDRLKEAVGNQNVKLVVSVSEEEYRRGRSILLRNKPL